MWPGRGSGLQWSTETSMRVGEDGRKVREVPSHGGTMHSFLGDRQAPEARLWVTSAWMGDDGQQKTRANLAAMEKSQHGMGGCTPSWHRLHQHHLPLPQRGGTAAWAGPKCCSGTSSEAVMVSQKPLSPHRHDLRGARPPPVHPDKVCRLPLQGSAPLPCPGQATGTAWSRPR